MSYMDGMKMTDSYFLSDGNGTSRGAGDNGKDPMLTAWKLISIAKDINAQPWEDIGLVYPKSLVEVSPRDPSRQIVHGIVSLLLVRIVALIKTQQHRRASSTKKVTNMNPINPKVAVTLSENPKAPSKSSLARGKSDSGALTLSDTSMKKLDEKSCFENRLQNQILLDEDLPKAITVDVLSDLYKYVTVISQHYRSVRYHSLEHAYHVLVSCNKLLNMLLDFAYSDESKPFYKSKQEKSGLISSPLNQLALLFAALIHDVDHRGITNQQLVKEGNELAIMYNDQSVAEQRSISFAFAELMKKRPLKAGQAPPLHEMDQFEYKHLCKVIFGKPSSEEYREFRRVIIDLVLSTDIASPERVQIVKSKYKEAFGHHSTSSPRPSQEKRAAIMPPPSVIESVLEEESSDFNGEEECKDAILPESQSEGEDTSNRVDKPEQRRSLKEEFINTRCSMKFESLSASISKDDEEEEQGSDDSSSSLQSNEDAYDQVDLEAVSPKKQSSPIRSNVGKRNVLRRASAPDVAKPQAHRLGIMRALNLTGSTITLFSASGEDIDQDLAFKTSALMELLLTAADVSSILQGWENYLKWSRRLFYEQMEAFEADRGFDPRVGWFENQINFLNSYGAHLAKQLVEVGIIGPKSCKFQSNVHKLKSRWIAEGRRKTEEMTQIWEGLRREKAQQGN